MKYYARNQYPGAIESGPYILSFSYLKPEHVKVFLDAEEIHDFNWIDDQTIELGNNLSLQGQTITIRRYTDASNRIVDFSSGAELEERDLDNSALQVFYIAQECVDLMQDIVSLEPDGSINVKGRSLREVRDAIAPTDGVNKRQLDAMMPLFESLKHQTEDYKDQTNRFMKAARVFRDEANEYAQGASDAEETCSSLLEQVLALKHNLEALAEQVSLQQEDIALRHNDITEKSYEVQHNTQQVNFETQTVLKNADQISKHYNQIEAWTNTNQQIKSHIEQAKQDTFTAKDIAITAANAISGSVKFGGPWDASAGLFPETPAVGSVFYKITKGGMLGNIDYQINDNLFYDHLENTWFKIDNTESVTSINGKQGVVNLSIADIQDLAEELITAKSGPVSTVAGKVGNVSLNTDDIQGLQTLLETKLAKTARAVDSQRLMGINASSFVRNDAINNLNAETRIAENTPLTFGLNPKTKLYFDATKQGMVQDYLNGCNALYLTRNLQPRFTFSIDNGSFTASGNITAFSDDRLKERFKEILNPLEKLKQLTGYSYFRKDLATTQIGLKASEVEAVLPDIVQTETFTNGEGPLGLDSVKSVAYGNLVALLIEGIKELE